MSNHNTINETSSFIENLKKIISNNINILLFDEIEKSNISILDKFLPILEDGKLNTNDENKINFSKSLIIFTSNIGASKINPKENDDEIREEFKKGFRLF